MYKNACSKNIKNKFLTIGLVLVLPLFLTACTLADLPVVGKFFDGDSSTEDGPPVVATGPASLNVWGIWERKEVMDVLVQKYNEVYPDVTINYEDRSVLKPLVDYKERAFWRATDPSGPDVMRVHISWVPALAASLEPMPDDIMDVETFRNIFYPVAADNLIIDGKIYGMPTNYDGLVLVYNKDHFEEIGQTEAPTAWEEFRRLALELTVKGEGNRIVRAGAAMGAADNIDFFSDILGMLFSQARVVVPSEIESEPAQHALAFYTNFVREDEVWAADLPEASVAFAQEKVSMIFVPTWNLLDILVARPDMNIGVAVPPQAEPDEPASWGSFWVDVVPQSSQNPLAAWSYVSFLAQEEQQLLTFSEASNYRVFGPPYSLMSLSGELADNPYLAPVLETANIANTNELAARAGNRRQEDAIKEAVNSVLGGRVTPEQALNTAKESL